MTICHLKEAVRALMSENGFPAAEVTHDPPRFGPNAVRLTVSVVEGGRSRTDQVQPLSILERCGR
jgi:hypothetical protein